MHSLLNCVSGIIWGNGGSGVQPWPWVLVFFIPSQPPLRALSLLELWAVGCPGLGLQALVPSWDSSFPCTALETPIHTKFLFAALHRHPALTFLKFLNVKMYLGLKRLPSVCLNQAHLSQIATFSHCLYFYFLSLISTP